MMPLLTYHLHVFQFDPVEMQINCTIELFFQALRPIRRFPQKMAL